jgi:hypothetical protein
MCNIGSKIVEQHDIYAAKVKPRVREKCVAAFSFENNFVVHYGLDMTAVEIIEEIKRLPKVEQSRVIEFARNAGTRRLTGDELGALAKQMVDAKDPAEADRLKEEIVRGFYGDEPHA